MFPRSLWVELIDSYRLRFIPAVSVVQLDHLKCWLCVIRFNGETRKMTSYLSHRFIFGINGSRSNGIAFSDQATIVYIAGHNLVVYNILEGKQRFIHGLESSESITAMALCPSARFIAMAEYSNTSTVSHQETR